MFTYMYTNINLQLCNIYTYTFIHISTYVYMYTYNQIYTYAMIFIYLRTHTHTHTHTPSPAPAPRRAIWRAEVTCSSAKDTWCEVANVTVSTPSPPWECVTERGGWGWRGRCALWFVWDVCVCVCVCVCLCFVGVVWASGSQLTICRECCNITDQWDVTKPLECVASLSHTHTVTQTHIKRHRHTHTYTIPFGTRMEHDPRRSHWSV